MSKVLLLSSAHPYLYETLHIKYPERLDEYADPIPPRSYDETPFTWVETPAQLSSLLDKLRVAKEIAVDLEYHSLRSYYGFVCLMQISTREEDWVIDTLALRDELEALNEVFTDPSIIKVCYIFPIEWPTSDVSVGLPWGGQRHCVVATRLQSVHRESLRHLSCFLSFGR